MVIKTGNHKWLSYITPQMLMILTCTEPGIYCTFYKDLIWDLSSLRVFQHTKLNAQLDRIKTLEQKENKTLAVVSSVEEKLRRAEFPPSKICNTTED